MSVATPGARPQAGRLAALPLGRVRGIPIRAHWTLVVALPVFAWLIAGAYFGSDAQAWGWGAGVAAALFVSVTIHELAHSLVALRRGVGVREIILLPIGGASIMDRPSRDPRDELLIASVGPLASLAVGGAGIATVLLLGIPLTFPRAVPAPQAFLLTISYLNVMLGLFNLLVPAFPMDGGRVLRALLARKVGILRATSIAAGIGRGLALLMGAAGLFGGNILLVLIAVFIWAGGRAEEQAVLTSTTLEGVKMRDIMSGEPVTIGLDATLDDALKTMLDTKHLALPVVRDGVPVGVVTAEHVSHVSADQRSRTAVGGVASTDLRTVPPEAEAAEALPTVLGAGLLLVVDAAGRLIGIVTPTDLLRFVQIRSVSAGGGA